MLDRILFKLKHWQMFLLGLAGLMLNSLMFKNEPGWKGIAGDILPVCVAILWFMLLGMRMKRHLPAALARPYVAFMTGGVFLIAGIVLGAAFKHDIQYYLQGKTLFIVVLCAAILCVLISFLGFIACATKTLQTRGKITVVDYGEDVLLWAVWLSGVWILQPRLNRLYDQYYS